MLERCVTDDAVLVDPTGRWEGVPGLAERIGRYQSAAPDTEVVTASGVDATLHAGWFPPAHSLSNAQSGLTKAGRLVEPVSTPRIEGVSHVGAGGGRTASPGVPGGDLFRARKPLRGPKRRRLSHVWHLSAF
jgi:hypothetical protein